MRDRVERFEGLYRRHFRAVLRYALGRVGPEEARDCVAETFLIAWRRLDDVPEEQLPWLLGVARRVIADQLRSGTRREALFARVAVSLAVREGSSPDAVAVERIVVLDALATLSSRDQEILKLAAWDDLEPTAAAAALGVSQIAYRVRLHRAKARLATALQTADRERPSRAANQTPRLANAKES